MFFFGPLQEKVLQRKQRISQSTLEMQENLNCAQNPQKKITSMTDPAAREAASDDPSLKYMELYFDAILALRESNCLELMFLINFK